LGDVGERFQAHAVVWEGEIAYRLAEENLVADNAGFGHRKNVIGIRLHDHAVKSVVGQELAFGDLYLLSHCLRVGRWRLDIRHVHHHRDAAADGGRRPGREVLLVAYTRLAEVYVAVDNSREDVISLGVYLLVAFRQAVIGPDGDKLPILDRDAALKGLLRRHHLSVFNDQIRVHLVP